MKIASHAIVEDHLPHHSIEAEMSALGSMMVSERAADIVSEILSDADFYVPAHRDVYRAIRQLLSERRAIDQLTVKNELEIRGQLDQIGGVNYLLQIVESVPSSVNAEHYAMIVLDHATLRRLAEAGRQIIRVVQEPDKETTDKIDEAERLIFEIGQQRLGKDFEPVRSLAKEFFKDVDRLYEEGQPLLGTPSGFYDLDDMTGGFYPGEFSIVAARPSMGKTSLVLNFALNIARKKEGAVAVFSLEMSGKQLVRRLLATLSGVSMGALQKPNMHDDDYQRLVDACELLYDIPLFIDDSAELSPMTLRGKCRRLKQEGGLQMIAVDYLQLMRSSRRTENRVQEISDIARSLKAVAKELEVPLVALSQLNRGVEARDNKRPMLSDLRESGSIEAEADLVMFIYRDSYYKRKENPEEEIAWDPNAIEDAEIIIAKHRNGPTGTVHLGFEAHLTRFRNLKR